LEGNPENRSSHMDIVTEIEAAARRDRQVDRTTEQADRPVADLDRALVPAVSVSCCGRPRAKDRA